MTKNACGVIPIVILQHANEVATLSASRFVLVRAPHVRLLHMARLDDRIAAHLDGLAVAGDFGSHLCEQSLEVPDSSRVFVVTVRAIEERDTLRLSNLAALVETVPEVLSGIMAAFAWVSADSLRGITARLLASRDLRRRNIGLAACAMHGVDPGKALDESLDHPDPFLRARALGVAAEVGRVELLPQARLAMSADEPVVRYWAAWSACLLGDRDRSIRVLAEVALSGDRFSGRALRLVPLVASFEWTHEFLRTLPAAAGDRDHITTRKLIRGAGLSGDVAYIPWLIRQMEDLKLTRIAGEAFSFITGADLAALDLERKPPEEFLSGPNDDPEDDDVSMDEDDGLPWPDIDRIQSWWTAHGASFTGDRRWFVGAEPTWEHCLHVLREGYQRQRIAAALHRCLLQPGTPLFNCAAPAWRQSRLLAQMS